LNAGTGLGGGGFYVSYSSNNSLDYGRWPTAILIKKGTHVMFMGVYTDRMIGTLMFESIDRYWSRKISIILGGPYYLQLEDKVALGKIIPFIDHYAAPSGYKDTWRVFHNSDVIGQVVPGFLLPQLKNQTMYSSYWDSLDEKTIYGWLDKMKNMTEWKEYYDAIDETRSYMQSIDFMSS
jgi:hypothetical protein